MLLNRFGQNIGSERPQRESPSRGEVVQLARQAQTLHGDLERLERGKRDGDALRGAFGMGALAGREGASVYQTGEPLRYQMPQDPRFRPFSPLSVDMLRTLARSNDIAADCISHLKREVVKVPLKVALKDEKDTSREAARQLAEATQWLSEEGGLGGCGVSRAVFEGQMLDDLLIVGAAALAFEFETRGARLDGAPSQVRAIDAATIQPLVSPYGFPRGADEAAFTQWVQGVPVGAFTRGEMIYEGLPSFARSDAPYFMSPTEDAAIQIYTLMRVDEWNRTWLTEGSGYRRWLKLNDSVTPDQAKAWLEIMKLQTQGNAQERHGIGVAPGEITGDESRRDQDFDGYENGRVTRICGSYGVNPASIGRHGEEHKDDQEAALGATRGGIVGEMLSWREQLYNRLLKMRGLDRVVVTEDVPSPSESTSERSTRQAQEIAGGVRTINMVMVENGQDPLDGGDELLLPGTLKPLSQIIAPPPAPDGGQNAGQESDDKRASGQSQTQPGGDKTSDKTGDIARAESVSRKTGDATIIDLSTGHQRAVERALGQWERKSLNRLERGQSAACQFDSEFLGPDEFDGIGTQLRVATTRQGVRDVFALARMAKRSRTTGNVHNTPGSFSSFWGDDARDDTTKAHFNGKNIRVAFTDKGEVEQRVAKLFSQTLSEADWKHLSGAPDGSAVEIAPHARDASKIVIMVKHPQLVNWGEDKGGAVQTLELGNVAGKANLYYDGLQTSGQVRGFGQRMVGYTIEAARTLGMGSLSLHAAGNPGDEQLVGYKVWPRMGFDASLSPVVQEKLRTLPGLPLPVRDAKSVSDLYRTEAGRNFWSEHGEAFDGVFDLNTESYAGKKCEEVKHEYFNRKGIKLQ